MISTFGKTFLIFALEASVLVQPLFSAVVNLTSFDSNLIGLEMEKIVRQGGEKYFRIPEGKFGQCERLCNDTRAIMRHCHNDKKSCSVEDKDCFRKDESSSSEVKYSCNCLLRLSCPKSIHKKKNKIATKGNRLILTNFNPKVIKSQIGAQAAKRSNVTFQYPVNAWNRESRSHCHCKRSVVHHCKNRTRCMTSLACPKNNKTACLCTLVVACHEEFEPLKYQTEKSDMTAKMKANKHIITNSDAQVENTSKNDSEQEYDYGILEKRLDLKARKSSRSLSSQLVINANETDRVRIYCTTESNKSVCRTVTSDTCRNMTRTKCGPLTAKSRRSKCQFAFRGENMTDNCCFKMICNDGVEIVNPQSQKANEDQPVLDVKPLVEDTVLKLTTPIVSNVGQEYLSDVDDTNVNNDYVWSMGLDNIFSKIGEK